MKHLLFRYLLFYLALMPGASLVTVAQTPDGDIVAITQALNFYLEGGTLREAATVRKAFLTNSQMLGLRDGQIVITPIEEYLANIKPGERQQRTTRIETITIMDYAASAKTVSEYDTFLFVDFFNLLRTIDGWKIVNKTFVRIEKRKQ